MALLPARHLLRMRIASHSFSSIGRNIVRSASSRIGTETTDQTLGTPPPRVCVVGGGPAGFYTAHQLLKVHKTVCVDIIEELPVPYGLVRFGVAPDHPEVKNCTEQFDAVATNARCEYFGNVALGKHVSVAELQERYTAVVLAYGVHKDRKLGIDGEPTGDSVPPSSVSNSLRGVHSAREFVGWYNGHPDFRALAPEISSAKTAVVIGHGNVALDVARVLTSPVDTILAPTDMTSAAVHALRDSAIKNVIVVGRRGPIEAAFTIKEIREQARLPGCVTTIAAEDVAFSDEESAWIASQRRLKRKMELMCKIAAGEEGNTTNATDPVSKYCQIVFRRSPVALLESPTRPGCVGGVRVEINSLESVEGKDLDARRAVGTGVYEDIPCDVVFTSVGYLGVAVDPEVPFDARRGVIPNTHGRVDAAARPGLYCSGWIKTGPTGVIATTMRTAYETAGAIAHDLTEGKLSTPVAPVPPSYEYFKQKNADVVTFADWQHLEAHEVAQGAAVGKVSEKCTSVAEMLAIMARARRQD
eukprot:m.375036 g.375036  ORF g.375036 m.375036 type:complete len:529 (-) comp20911_c0_seq5:103-1689(-)